MFSNVAKGATVYKTGKSDTFVRANISHECKTQKRELLLSTFLFEIFEDCIRILQEFKQMALAIVNMLFLSDKNIKSVSKKRLQI
jgi:hypothetical protein